MKYFVKNMECVESTQDEVKKLAEDGDREGLVIQALEQSQGRGRQGKKWESPAGNLYMSLLLRPECLADDVGQLAFVSGLAVSSALDVFLPSTHVRTLKWPNDVMVDGKKIAGILTETSIMSGRVEYVVAGFGVNVELAPEGAICLNDANGRENSVEGLRDTLLESFLRIYKVWQERGFASVRKAWGRQAHGLNMPVKVSMTEGDVVGTYRGIDEKGWFIVEDKNGNSRYIKAGSVFFL